MKVKQYIYSDPMSGKEQETTTHLAIYHEDADGERTLYRHFLRSPDGTLLEVFGDLVADYQGEYSALEKALLNAAEQVEEAKKYKWLILGHVRGECPKYKALGGKIECLLNIDRESSV